MDKENGMLISLNVECKKITMSFEIVENLKEKLQTFGSPLQLLLTPALMVLKHAYI